MLTSEELKKHVHYEPATGVFTRILSIHPKAKLGVVGTKTRTGYIQIGVLGKSYPAARLAWLYMTGKFPEGQADHRNRIRDDNRFSNLRDVTTSQNNYNTGVYKNNTSGFKGVTPLKNGRFRASARLDGKLVTLGAYGTKEEASAAYESFVKQFRGDYAPTTEIQGCAQEAPHKSKLK